VPLPQPPDDESLLIRTDFSDDVAWHALHDLLLSQADEDFVVDGVNFVDDRAFEGMSAAAIVALARDDHLGFVFLADRETMTGDEQTALAVDLWLEPGRTFRVTPSEVAPVQNSLSIANMDFHEFADNVDDDGVFRGNWREQPALTPTAHRPTPTVGWRRFALVELACWIFVVIGAAMVAGHASTEDVVLGVLAIAFFGSGAVLGLVARRRT
jgi:hypothetical protein